MGLGQCTAVTLQNRQKKTTKKPMATVKHISVVHFHVTDLQTGPHWTFPPFDNIVSQYWIWDDYGVDLVLDCVMAYTVPGVMMKM